MPSVVFRAVVNVHRDARCKTAFLGDDDGFGFGKIKVLSLTVLAAAGTHGYLPPFFALAS
jgi:hypothetical protein